MSLEDKLETALTTLHLRRDELIEELSQLGPDEKVRLLRYILKEVEAARSLLVAATVDIGEQLKKNRRAFPHPEMADMGFFARELERLLDDMRKDAKSQKELLGKLLCIDVMQESLEDQGNSDDVIHGKYARAECDMKMEAVLPKKGTPEYRKLLEHFGVSDEAIDHGLFSIHWNWMKEYLTELAQQGKKTPPGVLDTNPSYYAKFVRKSSNRKDR